MSEWLCDYGEPHQFDGPYSAEEGRECLVCGISEAELERWERPRRRQRVEDNGWD